MVLLFAIWMYFRNTIWAKETLDPIERLAIYARDGAWYFLLLRAAFVFTWLYAVVLLYTTGKPAVSWIACGVYALFLLADNLILGVHYLRFLGDNQPGELASPVSLISGILEAIFTLSFNVVIIQLFRKQPLKADLV